MEKIASKSKINYVLGLVSGAALMVIVFLTFPPIFASGSGAARSPQAGSELANQATMLNMEEVGTKLSHIFQIIDQHYIGDFDLHDALDLMFAGFVYAVGDPYTVYMNAETFARFRDDTEGTFIGIGVSITVDTTDNRILVISPIEGSPAFEAGIIPGDKIIRVNDNDVFGDAVNEAVRMMRGEAGTSVDVTILRETSEGTQTIEKTIVRDIIQIETVRSNIIDENIGYIRISQFDRVTYEQFKLSYAELLSQNIEGLILDLRNNPGGLLDVVNNITDMLVPEGIITYTEDVRGNRVYAFSDARQIEIPLLVLVNGNSASASEVLSGAVRDTGIGELVGTTTFGKGLVQNVFVLPDASAVKVTVARYFTPAGISIHGEGITPNHYVEMPTELTNNLLTLGMEDDIQLLHAIELMLDMIN